MTLLCRYDLFYAKAVILLILCIATQPERSDAADGLAGLLQEAESSPEQVDKRPAVVNRDESVTSNDTRSPIPSSEQQKASSAKVRDAYGADAAAAKDPAAKSRLAQQLLEQAETERNSADRFALLEAARALAIEAGDAATVQKYLAAVSRTFTIDAAALRSTTYEELASKSPPQSLAPVINLILEAADGEADKGQLEAAEQLAKAASAAARRARDPALTKRVTGRLADLRTSRKQEAQLQPFLERLAADPTDREAALCVGKVRCFDQGRWAEGVQLLARGNDPRLAGICALELKQDKKPNAAAADAWWDYSTEAKGPLAEKIKLHAADLYQQALTGLVGLDQVRAKKRIEEAAFAGSGEQKAVPLADVKETRVAGAKYGFSKDGTYMGKPFTCMNERWPKAIAAISDGSVAAVVEYQFPASVSRIQGRVGIFSPPDAKPEQQPGGPIVFEVVADGRVVWRSPPMTKRDTAQPFRADLRGATSIELRTQAQSGYCAWGAWLDPQVVR